MFRRQVGRVWERQGRHAELCCVALGTLLEIQKSPYPFPQPHLPGLKGEGKVPTPQLLQEPP